MRKSLSKAEILRNRRDIQRVFRSKAVFRIHGLHLRIVANDLGWSRVLFATTRALRGSVRRNRARRLVREAFRLYKGQIQSGYDFAFVLYPGDFGFQERNTQVDFLLRRAGALLSQTKDQ